MYNNFQYLHGIDYYKWCFNLYKYLYSRKKNILYMRLKIKRRFYESKIKILGRI